MSNPSGPQPGEWPLENCPPVEHEPTKMLVMPGYEKCILGIVERCGQDPFVLYDPEKVLRQLMVENQWEHDAAAEWLDFNMCGAWVGEGTPGFLAPYTEPDDG